MAPPSAMHPDDLAIHRAVRARRDKRALAASLRHAYLNGTLEEKQRLGAIVQAVAGDSLSPGDARDLVAGIRREQERRRAEAA